MARTNPKLATKLLVVEERAACVPTLVHKTENPVVLFGCAQLQTEAPAMYVIEEDLSLLKLFAQNYADDPRVVLIDPQDVRELAWTLEGEKPDILLANPSYKTLKDSFQEHLLGIALLLTQYVDMGKRAFRNAASHGPLWTGSHFKDSQAGKTALVVGAGPSLDAWMPVLKKLPKDALVYACGSCAQILADNDVPVSFIVAIDTHVPKERYTNLPKAPMLIHLQTDSFLSQDGAFIFGTNECFPYLDHALHEMGGAQLVQGGWNAGTFGVALSHFMGVSKIVTVGIDSTRSGYADGIQDSHERSKDELREVQAFLAEYSVEPLNMSSTISSCTQVMQGKKLLPFKCKQEWDICMEALNAPTVLSTFEKEETALYQKHLLFLYDVWKYRLNYPDRDSFYRLVLNEICP